MTVTELQTMLDPVLVQFRYAVRAAYGDRLERLVLFGSRARGDHGPESDYDVAVFLLDMGRLWDELGILAPIVSDLLVEAGEMVSAKPFPACDYHCNTSLMRNIRAEGIEL